MNVIIDGQRVTLSAQDSLGAGGEATVTRYKNLAVKIFHVPTSEKSEKLREMIGTISTKLPQTVVAPRDLVYDEQGKKIIGFTMDALGQGYEPFSSLSRRGVRSASGIGTGQIAQLFLSVYKDLESIHAAGAIVGDFNDLNELYSNSMQPAWIDVDSFQIPGFPCDVATESFLDPNTYGPDITAPVLTQNGKPRIFKKENDWYSYAVLLFRSLTLVHPYGGVDPQLPTIPKRAAAHKSVFDKSVKYPAKVGYAIEVMSNDMLDEMQGIFDRGQRFISFSKIYAYKQNLVECGSCKSQYPRERSRCPSCAALAPPPPMISTKLECTTEDILTADGDIIAMDSIGDTIRCISVTGRKLVVHTIQQGGASRVSQMLTNSVRHSAGFLGAAISNSLAIACVAVNGGSPALQIWYDGDSQQTSTEYFGSSSAAFGCSQSSYYRLARGMLMKGTINQGVCVEKMVTQAAVNQTWIQVSRHLSPRGDTILGCSRIFNDRHYFLVVGPSRIDIDKSWTDNHNGVIVDENVIFSDKYVFLLRKFQRSGIDYIDTLVLDLDGNRVASYVSSVNDRVAGDVIRGGCAVGQSLILATDRGLAREKFSQSSQNLSEKKLFESTEPFVASESIVTPYGGGLAVAHGSRIRVLKMS